MSPWTLVGWELVSIISILCLIIGFKIITLLIKSIIVPIGNYLGYLRTRNITPKERQVWKDRGNYPFRIDRVFSDGAIKLYSQSSTGPDWIGISQEEWKNYVRSRGMRLVSK